MNGTGQSLEQIVTGLNGATPSDEAVRRSFLKITGPGVSVSDTASGASCAALLALAACRPVGRLQRPRREPDDEAAGAPRGARKAEVGQYGRLEFELEAVEPQPRGPCAPP